MTNEGTGASRRRRSSTLAASAAILLVCALRATAEEPADPYLSIDDAVRMAIESHPRAALEKQGIERSRGRLQTAQTFPFNPELSGSGARRDGADGDSTDYGAELSQEFEIAGQWGLRIAGARADLIATGEEARWSLLELRADVERAFVDTMRTQEALDIGRAGADIARRLLELTDRREQAGTASKIELSAVRADLGRAIAELALLEADHDVARETLAELVGWRSGPLPPLVGELGTGGVADWPPVDALVEEALTARADLRALQAREEEAEARVSEADRAWAPNLTVGAFVEREEGTDTIAGGRLSIPLPVWNRGTGEAASARAAGAQARSARELATLAVRREIASAHARWRAARRAIETLDTSAVAPLEANLALLDRAFAARRVAWGDVLLIRRSFVDARRARVDALAQAAMAAIDLRLATGRMDAESYPFPGHARTEDEDR